MLSVISGFAWPSRCCTSMLGEPFDPLSWQEFGVPFEQWLTTVKSYGLDGQRDGTD
jgi:hypothetical protein